MNSLTFPQQLRLRHKVDFESVFRRSKKSTDVCFAVLYRGNRLPYARLGLAISRRCARRAVVRNRIKRLVRESFRHQQLNLAGLDIVVIGKVTLINCSNAELFSSLNQHWQTLTQ